MNKINSLIKGNIGSIATAVLAVVLVLNYLFYIVPENEKRIDDYHKFQLKEFNSQFNAILKDYANSLNTDSLLRNIINHFNAKLNKEDKVKLIEGLDSLKDWKNRFIIDKINLNKLNYSLDGYLSLHYDLILKFNQNDTELNTLNKSYLKNNQDLSRIDLTINVKKGEFLNRIRQAVQFPYWGVFENSEIAKNSMPNPIFIDGIEFSIADSVLKSKAKSSGICFANSDKRFYKQTYQIEGTDRFFVFIGAVDRSAFDHESKRIDISLLIFYLFITCLLFISIPLIKPLISSSRERMTQFDLMSTTFSIGTLVIVSTCYFFVILFDKSGNSYIDSELKTLNSKAVVKFKNELDSFKASKYFDTIDKSPEIIRRIALQKVTASGTIKTLQNYFLMSPKGDMMKEYYKENNHYFRKNFKDREYMKILKDKYQYKSSLSGVYSKNDNNYKLVYAKESTNKYVKGLAYTQHAFDSLELKHDYGVLICNAHGRVILHSDSRKNLSENIYWNSNYSYNVLKLFRGYDSIYFDAIYDKQKCRFYGSRFFYEDSTAKIKEFPAYLLSFKILEFDDDVKLYTFINGLVISLAYILLITLLSLLYSVVFYYGHKSAFSRFHISWLFPDVSKRNEHMHLRYINYICVAIITVRLLTGGVNLLFHSVLTGVNLHFLNFILLAQRKFNININSKERTRFFLIIAAFFILSYGISCYLFFQSKIILSLLITLLLQFLVIILLKGEKVKETFLTRTKDDKCGKTDFTRYLKSAMVYHYFLIPVITVFSLYIYQKTLENSYNESESLALKNVNQTFRPPHTDLRELLLSKFTLVNSPSESLLAKIGFSSYDSGAAAESFGKVIPANRSVEFIGIIMLFIFLIFLLIRGLVRYYSGRFFFFDLAEAGFLKHFEKVNAEGENSISEKPIPITIIPPYDKEDLLDVEKYFLKEDEINRNKLLSDIPTHASDRETLMELILAKNMKVNLYNYKIIWNDLSDDEKYVLYDFAIDHFFNYKNKIHIYSLMQKGIIITDPLTGRLRIENFGFRYFIVKHPEIDQFCNKQEEDNSERKVFSKWKLPILIIAITVLMLLAYVYNQSFEHILVIGGSLTSAFGLVMKFMDGYKKIS